MDVHYCLVVISFFRFFIEVKVERMKKKTLKTPCKVGKVGCGNVVSLKQFRIVENVL